MIALSAACSRKVEPSRTKREQSLGDAGCTHGGSHAVEWNECISFLQQQIFKHAISTTEQIEGSSK